MKKFLCYIILVFLFFGYASCTKSIDNNSEEPEQTEPIEPTEPIDPIDPTEPIVRQNNKTDIDNNFAFHIFKEVLTLNGDNTFFSPLSLNMALGMLYNGSSGDTRVEMAEVLGMADFTETESNEYYQKMMQTLLASDPLTEIGIANSIWYRDGFPVKQSFIDINQKYFDAAVMSLDFSKPDAVDIINNWCADKTKDKIKEIIEKQISNDIMMYLINALYFKSNWQFEFDKADTKQDDFTKSNSQTKKVNMMEQTAALPYYVDQYLQCIEMPYGNQAFSMMAILPAADMDIEQLIDYLDNTKFQNIVDNLYPRVVWLRMPRFKIECDILLNDPLEKVGLQRMFDKNFADFNSIYDKDKVSDNLYVSKIKQKTFVEVSEEGTEAAAVTVIEVAVGESQLLPPPPVQFFANRPFLYLIREKSTGAILFIGRMDEPKE